MISAFMYHDIRNSVEYKKRYDMKSFLNIDTLIAIKIATGLNYFSIDFKRLLLKTNKFCGLFIEMGF